MLVAHGPVDEFREFVQRRTVTAVLRYSVCTGVWADLADLI